MEIKMEVKYKKPLSELNHQVGLGLATYQEFLELEMRKKHLKESYEAKQQNKHIL